MKHIIKKLSVGIASATTIVGLGAAPLASAATINQTHATSSSNTQTISAFQYEQAAQQWNMQYGWNHSSQGSSSSVEESAYHATTSNQSSSTDTTSIDSGDHVWNNGGSTNNTENETGNWNNHDNGNSNTHHQLGHDDLANVDVDVNANLTNSHHHDNLLDLDLNLL